MLAVALLVCGCQVRGRISRLRGELPLLRQVLEPQAAGVAAALSGLLGALLLRLQVEVLWGLKAG